MGRLLQAKMEEWLDGYRREGFAEGYREGLAEFRREDIAAGQRELLEGMARTRFGADAARHLSAAFNGATSERLIADVADLVVSCGTETEFVEGLDRLHRA